MSVESNKQIARQFYAALEREDYTGAAQFCHPDFVFYHQMDTPIRGTDNFIAAEKQGFDPFPGFRLQVERLVAEGDQVAAYIVFDGEHTRGVLDGIVPIAPTGKRLRFSLLMLLKIVDGKIIEERSHFDRMDAQHQLAGKS
jgi:predicted ester cyclase